MEALDSILTCLHESLAKKREDGSSDYCEPACLVHQVSALHPAAWLSSSLSHALSLLQVFGINVMEQSECSKCGCSSEPVLSQGWIHYGYTNDLMYPFRLLPGFWRVPYLMSVSSARLRRNVHVAYPQLGFGKLLHLAGDQGLRSCVNEVSSFATTRLS